MRSLGRPRVTPTAEHSGSPAGRRSHACFDPSPHRGTFPSQASTRGLVTGGHAGRGGANHLRARCREAARATLQELRASRHTEPYGRPIRSFPGPRKPARRAPPFSPDRDAPFAAPEASATTRQTGQGPALRRVFDAARGWRRVERIVAQVEAGPQSIDGQADEPMPRRETANLRSLVGAAALAAGLHEAGEPDWLNDVPEDLDVTADRRQLHRVLTNLARNAVRVTSVDGLAQWLRPLSARLGWRRSRRAVCPADAGCSHSAS